MHLRVRQGICWALAVFAALTVASASPSARAETITDIGSLEPIIEMDPTAITVGNLQFYGFTYTGSQPPNPAPTALHVDTGAIISQPMGLSFSAAWQSAMSYSQDSVISYYVHVTDGTTPQQGIMTANLWFNGASLLNLDAMTSASVTETVMSLDGTTLGQLSVFADGNQPFADRPNASLTLGDCYRDLYITEDISLHSSATGLTTISAVDTTFGQCTIAPLPSTAWAGLALLSALAAPRLLRRGKLPVAANQPLQR